MALETCLAIIPDKGGHPVLRGVGAHWGEEAAGCGCGSWRRGRATAFCIDVDTGETEDAHMGDIQKAGSAGCPSEELELRPGLV